jgi:DNA-binding CsgD family transcriptional regulator
MGMIKKFEITCHCPAMDLAAEVEHLAVRLIGKFGFKPFSVHDLDLDRIEPDSSPSLRISFGENAQGSVDVNPIQPGEDCVLSVQFPDELVLVWDELQNRLVELGWIHYGDLPDFCKPHARKIEALALAAEGLRNREIAQRMGLHENSVRTYLNLLYRKSGAASRKDLIAKVRKLGWL